MLDRSIQVATDLPHLPAQPRAPDQRDERESQQRPPGPPERQCLQGRPTFTVVTSELLRNLPFELNLTLHVHVPTLLSRKKTYRLWPA